MAAAKRPDPPWGCESPNENASGCRRVCLCRLCAGSCTSAETRSRADGRVEATTAQMRRAPTYVRAYHPVIDDTFTTSPVCGAWMNWFWPM